MVKPNMGIPPAHLSPPKIVSMADRTVIDVVGTCDLISMGKHLRLSNVYHIPALADNLISVSQLCTDGHRVHFSNDSCVLEFGNGEVVPTKQHAGLYSLSITQIESANSVSDVLLHDRYGHPSDFTMKSVVPGYQPSLCEACALGTQKRRRF